MLQRPRTQQPAEDHVRDAGLPATGDGRGLVPRLKGQHLGIQSVLWQAPLLVLILCLGS